MKEPKDAGAVRKKRVRKSTIQLYSMCAIPLLHIFVFCYVPMFGIIIAFKDYKFNKGIFGSEWVGFRNFQYFFGAGTFARLVRNTIGMNFLFILTTLITSVGLAVLLFHVKRARTIKVVQTMMITPNFVSWVVASYVVYAILSPSNGLLNILLENLGHQKIDWYSTAEAWPVILTLCNIWKGVGMGSVLYYATLTGIDAALFEAARIDGASGWQEIRYIMLPGLKTIIIIQQILAVGGMFRSDFGLFYSVTRDMGALYKYTDVLDTYIFRMTRVVGDMGVSAASSLAQSLVGMALVLLTNWIVRRIESESALF